MCLGTWPHSSTMSFVLNRSKLEEYKKFLPKNFILSTFGAKSGGSLEKTVVRSWNIECFCRLVTQILVRARFPVNKSAGLLQFYPQDNPHNFTH